MTHALSFLAGCSLTIASLAGWLMWCEYVNF